MSEFKVNTITNRDGSHGPQVCGITTFGSSGMQLPSGPTEFRGGRGRGIVGGGRNNPSPAVAELTIDMHEIATTGNAVDFGDLMGSNTGAKGGGFGSATRAILAGGYNPSPLSAVLTQIQYVVMSSQGGANDFGDSTTAKNGIPPASDNTRGILQGGATPDYTSEMSSIAKTDPCLFPAGSSLGDIETLIIVSSETVLRDMLSSDFVSFSISDVVIISTRSSSFSKRYIQ